MKIYMDTSALIALIRAKDKHHKSASFFLKESIQNGNTFIIGKNVLIEYIDGLNIRMGKKTAIQEFNRLINSKVIRLVFDTPEDWKRAKQIFDKYKYEDIGFRATQLGSNGHRPAYMPKTISVMRIH